MCCTTHPRILRPSKWSHIVFGGSMELFPTLRSSKSSGPHKRHLLSGNGKNYGFPLAPSHSIAKKLHYKFHKPISRSCRLEKKVVTLLEKDYDLAFSSFHSAPDLVRTLLQKKLYLSWDGACTKGELSPASEPSESIRFESPLNSYEGPSRSRHHFVVHIEGANLISRSSLQCISTSGLNFWFDSGECSM